MVPRCYQFIPTKDPDLDLPKGARQHLLVRQERRNTLSNNNWRK
jgi:hypothetical protein